jgi:hypothetical protein
MMFSPGKQVYDDQLLIRYLLGSLSEQETERLDELSIVGDDFACRLSEVENDLVDTYVSGQLSGETLERFRSSYLSSAARREKVRFAEALLAHENGAASAPAGNTATAIPESTDPDNVSRRHWWLFPAPRLTLNWGFAGAMCLIIAGSGYLLREHFLLRSRLYQAQADRSAVQQREGELQKQLDAQRARESLDHAEQRSGTPSHEPKTVSFILLAETRGAGRVAPIAVPPGTDRAVLQLQLEFDDFPEYRADLRDPVTNQIVWRSRNLTTMPLGGNRAVSVGLPASQLKRQNYTLELTGIPANGAAEPLGSYAFRVVIE